MSICIAPLSPDRLRVTGDVDAELRIPYDSDEDRFHLAMSDGTLIVGEYEPESDRFLEGFPFSIAVRFREGVDR